MMKKISILIMFIAISYSAFAQDGKFSWGVKAGLNLSNFWGSEADGAKIKAGYQVGLMGEYRATSLLAIAPELVFSTQGAKGDDLTWNINYVNLPIMAKFYVAEPLSIDFGPEIGIAVFNHINGIKAPSETYNKFNFGLGLGATYNFGKIFASARYTMGLTDIVKDVNMKNYNIQIGLGYKF